MNDPRYIELLSNPGTVLLDDIPVLEYADFVTFIDLLMGEEGTHCVAYFVFPRADKYKFICCMAADENHALLLFSHEQPADPGLTIPSLTARHFQFHIFEREIHEQVGIGFNGHPWLKPVRFPFNGADRENRMDSYPFYSIDGDELHEVGVGPVHAGIIEPGHFRFICQGEQVLHLEIHLGYQHRGLERLFVEKQNILHQSVLAESIAGDTAVGHSLAHAALIESLAGVSVSRRISVERIIALELERIGVHIGDTAALCTDIAYQFGQVVNEALRTIIINTTQFWCGNRFGKGLVRPGGSNYPLTRNVIVEILANLKEVEERYFQITDRIFSLPSVLSRFEGTGKVTTMQASLIGAVGMAAKSSGMYRDIRWSHPFSAFVGSLFEPVMLHQGDVWSRAMLRRKEVEQSIAVIRGLLNEYGSDGDGNGEYANGEYGNDEYANYELSLGSGLLGISLTEGWRGEICHMAITDNSGKIIHYKAKDPSLHNWMALALAVRNQEISDFPLCNKSFNLSYCGNDL
jgi:Ni,Fe-hydrogenase III large subunit